VGGGGDETLAPKKVDRVELGKLIAGGAQLVEVLPPDEYAEDHLPGAINIPLGRVDAEAEKKLDKNRPVIVYCWDSA
jgi:rhodanese-related sulfurtransferase